jgi:hypothetical protein
MDETTTVDPTTQPTDTTTVDTTPQPAVDPTPVASPESVVQGKIDAMLTACGLEASHNVAIDPMNGNVVNIDVEDSAGVILLACESFILGILKDTFGNEYRYLGISRSEDLAEVRVSYIPA